MDGQCAIKGVVSGIDVASEGFPITCAIGKIGRKLTACSAVADVPANIGASTEIIISGRVARSSELQQVWAKDRFCPIISDHAAPRRGRKLRAAAVPR